MVCPAIPIPCCLILITLMPAGCKDRGGGTSAPTNGGKIAVYCVRCETTGRIAIADDPADEIWPEPCPSCDRTGAYPSENCPGCAKPTVMMDPRTRGYGKPMACPHCGQAWTQKTL